MKVKIIIASLLFFLVTFVSCKSADKKSNVPEPVSAKFSSMYPEAAGIEWKMDEGKYVATFHQNRKDLRVIMTEDGTIVRFEEIIDPSRLPANIREYVTAELEGKKISSAITYTDPKGQNSYEIEVDHRHYVFAKDGQFVGKRNGE
ncbi:MAG TPA: hypothetical protein VFG10_10225 [Saprospiraceae bacterium]|nr:hypothetical protein [Saprospiraceae bacterium]